MQMDAFEKTVMWVGGIILATLLAIVAIFLFYDLRKHSRWESQCEPLKVECLKNQPKHTSCLKFEEVCKQAILKK